MMSLRFGKRFNNNLPQYDGEVRSTLKTPTLFINETNCVSFVIRLFDSSCIWLKHSKIDWLQIALFTEKCKAKIPLLKYSPLRMG